MSLRGAPTFIRRSSLLTTQRLLRRKEHTCPGGRFQGVPPSQRHDEIYLFHLCELHFPDSNLDLLTFKFIFDYGCIL